MGAVNSFRFRDAYLHEGVGCTQSNPVSVERWTEWSRVLSHYCLYVAGALLPKIIAAEPQQQYVHTANPVRPVYLNYMIHHSSR